MAEADKSSTISDYALTRIIPTRWSDNDIYGHMNNVVHYSLFDTAINSWLTEQGAIDPHHGDHIGLVVETGCRYFDSLAFPGNVIAAIRVAHIGSSSVRYEIALLQEDSDVIAAEGFFIHVYVDRQTRRPKKLDDKFRAVLQKLQV